MTFQVTVTASNALHPSQSKTSTVKVVAPADLTISSSAPSAVIAGDMLITTITLRNDGPGDDTFPPGGSMTQKIATASWNDPHYLNNVVYATTAHRRQPAGALASLKGGADVSSAQTARQRGFRRA